MNNLSNLATESDECRALLYKSLLSPFLDQVDYKPMGITFDTAPWKGQPVFFWKFVLREALHSAKFGMFSDKSAVSFLQRVQAEKLRAGWLQCKKDYGVYLQADGRVFVFRPSSFPWHKMDMYNVLGERLEFDQDKQVGPWIIRAEVVSSTSSNLSQKAVPSMDFFMDGNIEYYLETPGSHGNSKPRPLVFCHFQKPHRPVAWKSIDLKIQSTLPLVGNDETAQQEMQNKDQLTCIVRVTLRLDN